MLIVENILLSNEILDRYFCCDLQTCKGVCCMDGDAGAPLEEKEIAILEKYFPVFRKYMTQEGAELIEKKGVFDFDDDNEYVTPLLKNDACAYIFFDDNIAKCAIEKSFLNNEIDFQKPISCHLYPIRITKLPDYETLNLHKWSICKVAFENGEKKNIRVFQFLKEPLIRKFGEEWYNSLEKEFLKE